MTLYASTHANNNDVKIHYYDSLEKSKSDGNSIPLVVCPGLSETAEEYIDLLEAVSPRRCILLSFRGRGGSDTPVHGYNLDDHVSDLEAVVRHAGVELFHLFGYSRGASYALGYAQKHKGQIKSLILGDYPPEHRAMSEDWTKDYIHNYLMPHSRTNYIRPEAVLGIQSESSQSSLENVLSMNVLVARGKLQGSLITDSDLLRYKEMCSRLSIKEYRRSGHDIKEKEKELFYSDVVSFLAGINSSQ
ncbi:alpha/beta fold hydrolase [Paenibacillus sepulcri]|uniref:Alpha/beta hydrolase n=1 Tax=Paenibacillus sepulcri TaxID=359917 RepID=A0ABS7C2A0_9BACL|nr:alpha/beta hydrolase [Paenibacillus sepulcri]